MKSLGHLRVLDLDARARRPVVYAAAGRPWRRCDQDRAPGQRRRHARVGPTVSEGFRWRGHFGSCVLPVGQPRQALGHDRHFNTLTASRWCTSLPSIATSWSKTTWSVNLAKYKLDYAIAGEINARLIYCSITGFGQTGPHRTRAGYDFIMQGIGGFMSITGERDDRPGGGPQKAGVAVSDLMTGMYSTVAILAAVTHRERTGEGQYIDMALYDVMVAMLANMNMNYLTSRQSTGPRRQCAPEHRAVSGVCRDGRPRHRRRGKRLAVRQILRSGRRAASRHDARYRRNADRVRNRAVLDRRARSDCARASRSPSGSKRLDAAGVPCGPINDIAHALNDPQVDARGMRIDLAHALAGHVPMVANPIKLSATPPSYGLPPPLLGEHTASVLRDYAGVDEKQLNALKSRGIV